MKLFMSLQELAKTVAKLAEDGKVLPQILAVHLSHYVLVPILPFYLLTWTFFI